MEGKRLSRLLVPLALLAAAAAADVPGQALGQGTAVVREERARVAEVVDGDTVVLNDGRQVRLVGIQAPKLPLGRPGFKAWPLADEAKAALVELALGRDVWLGYGGHRMDRHGRQLAHLFTSGGGGGGVWIQGEMLKRGLARVYTFADNRALAAEMLAQERAARAAGRGIWSDPYYAIRTPENAERDIGSFQLVEGRVLKVAEVQRRTYVNFGTDWRSDFTVVLGREAAETFRAAGFDPAEMEGRQIRVRGWLKSFNGPMIEATHPEQIEVLAQ